VRDVFKKRRQGGRDRTGSRRAIAHQSGGRGEKAKNMSSPYRERVLRWRQSHARTLTGRGAVHEASIEPESTPAGDLNRGRSRGHRGRRSSAGRRAGSDARLRRGRKKWRPFLTNNMDSGKLPLLRLNWRRTKNSDAVGQGGDCEGWSEARREEDHHSWLNERFVSESAKRVKLG